MRLLYVIDSLAPGGAETSLAEMALGLIANGIDLHVLPLGPRLDLAPALEDAGAIIHRRVARPGRLNNVREVVRVGRAIRPDLIHTTLFEADIAGRVGATILRIPASTSLVNDSYGPSHYAEAPRLKLHLARTLDALTIRRASRLHAITAAIAESVPPRLGYRNAKVEVIPRGRDPQRFPYRTAEVRERVRSCLGVSNEAPVVLGIGRLEPQKGFQHLLRALPLVAEHHPDLVCLIAGKDGRAADSLRAQAASLNVDVRFLGHRTDIADLLSAADVFCFPSEREGFGGVLIEAMAVGCPIVASAIPTTREVLGDGEFGALMLTGDHEDLAEKLTLSLNGRDDPSPSAKRAFIAFIEQYASPAVIARMAEFFSNPN